MSSVNKKRRAAEKGVVEFTRSKGVFFTKEQPADIELLLQSRGETDVSFVREKLGFSAAELAKYEGKFYFTHELSEGTRPCGLGRSTYKQRYLLTEKRLDELMK